MPLDAAPAPPLIGLMRAPERFVFLTYVACAALAGNAIADFGLRIVDYRKRGQSALRTPHFAIVAGLVGLLLLEMPLHVRYMEPMVEPASMVALGQEPGPGAVLELPLTQHGWVDTPRMFNQIAHGRPITSGYLSRAIIDPYTPGLLPVRAVQRLSPPGPARHHHPHASALPGAALGQWGRVHHRLQAGVCGPPRHFGGAARPAGRAARPGKLGWARRSPTTRRRRSTGCGPTMGRGAAWQLGPDWNSAEQSGGQPFRWLNGAQGDFCVFSPAGAHDAAHLPGDKLRHAPPPSGGRERPGGVEY